MYSPERNLLFNGTTFTRININKETTIDKGYWRDDWQFVVVDFEKSPNLRSLFEKAKEKATENHLNERSILEATFNVVLDRFSRGREGIDIKFLQKHPIPIDGKTPISLDFYIEAGFGACLQTSLISAAILERFRNEEFLKGYPTLEVLKGDLTGHMRCEYKSPTDQTFVLDVIYEFFGTEEEFNEKIRPEMESISPRFW